jgi:hypothetical protein
MAERGSVLPYELVFFSAPGTEYLGYQSITNYSVPEVHWEFPLRGVGANVHDPFLAGLKELGTALGWVATSYRLATEYGVHNSIFPARGTAYRFG